MSMTSPLPWWTDAVCYQIYIRSFADSSGDPMGDMNGITAHLDHLVDLGVDAIWLNPFYPSPQHDHGYDVSDYRDVEPAYGTLADFDAMLAAAHQRGIKVIVDVVPNHSSSEHPWFVEALAAEKGSPARDRYMFRDGTGPDGAEPPNNWLSIFGGPAWTRVADGQWYLHLFDTSQPDFNWRNPEIPADFEKTLRFWLDRGVDGFRIDVAHALFKEEGLPSIPEPEKALDRRVLVAPMWEQEEGHEIFRQWRKILDEYPGDRMAVGEAWAATPEGTAKYVRPDELQQTFNFHWLVAPWSADGFRKAITDTFDTLRPVGAEATWVLSNHDVVRHPSRYSDDPEIGRARGRAATLTMLSLPGSAYIYQGEELGLLQVDVPENQRQDPEFLNGRGPGRDGCRVPLPWSGSESPYGFSSGEATWLPQPADWAKLTVEAQTGDANSTLAFYRRALAKRRELIGDDWTREIEWLDLGSDLGSDVVAFRRGGVTVAVNCGENSIPLPAGEVLLSSDPVGAELPPNTAVWVR